MPGRSGNPAAGQKVSPVQSASWPARTATSWPSSGSRSCKTRPDGIRTGSKPHGSWPTVAGARLLPTPRSRRLTRSISPVPSRRQRSSGRASFGWLSSRKSHTAVTDATRSSTRGDSRAVWGQDDVTVEPGHNLLGGRRSVFRRQKRTCFAPPDERDPRLLRRSRSGSIAPFRCDLVVSLFGSRGSVGETGQAAR